MEALPLLVAVTVSSAPVGQAFAGIEGERLRLAFEETAHRGRQDETVIRQCFRERLQRAHRYSPHSRYRDVQDRARSM